jgi:hypothetical protein
MEPGASFIVMLDDSSPSMEKPLPMTNSTSLPLTMELTGKSENSLTIDYARLSYDNVLFEEPWPIMALSDRLVRERKNRKIYLKYEFTIKEMPESLYLEAESMNSRMVSLNGELLTNPEMGTIDRSFRRYDIAGLIQPGHNEAVFEINYYQSEHVYKVLLDVVNGSESLINCLSYDTDIECIYLRGDFEVYSESGFLPAEKRTLVSEGDFYLTKSKSILDLSNVVCYGYPFFAGQIEIKTTFFRDTLAPCRLVLQGRYANAHIYINERYAGMMLFSHECDIAPYINVGKNKLKIVLINSNRNLLGPFHCSSDVEPYSVNPGTFEMRGTWSGSKGRDYRNSYSFVQFGLDSLEIKS